MSDLAELLLASGECGQTLLIGDGTASSPWVALSCTLRPDHSGDHVDDDAAVVNGESGTSYPTSWTRQSGGAG